MDTESAFGCIDSAGRGQVINSNVAEMMPYLQEK